MKEEKINISLFCSKYLFIKYPPVKKLTQSLYFLFFLLLFSLIMEEKSIFVIQKSPLLPKL